MNNVKISELYDLTHTLAADYLKGFTAGWIACLRQRLDCRLQIVDSAVKDPASVIGE